MSSIANLSGYRRKGKKIAHFGDKRDAFIEERLKGNKDAKNPCSSRGMSTMPRRERTEKNKSGYVPETDAA